MTNLQWQRHLVLTDDWRPIRPDDQVPIHDLLLHATKEDLRLRFFDSLKEFSYQFIAKLTQLDYVPAMAFAAIGAPILCVDALFRVEEPLLTPGNPVKVAETQVNNDG